jgi:hypothetical protein
MGIPYEHDDNIDLRDLEEVELNNLTVNSLNISGTLGVGEFQDVGTAGAVLTSNGLGVAVSWKEPVYYSAHLTSDITYSNNIYAIPQNVTGLTVDTISHSGSFDGATGIFTAPRDGIYYVDFGVLVSDYVNPTEVYELTSRIDFRTNSSGTFAQHTGNFAVSGAGDTARKQSNVSSILQLNTGNQIRSVFLVLYNLTNSAHGTKLLATYDHPNDSERDSLRATRQSVFAIF